MVLLSICFVLVLLMSCALSMPIQRFQLPGELHHRNNADIVAAMVPGDPMITGTIAQGFINAISIYSNVILAR